jgi:hypothetical protein
MCLGPDAPLSASRLCDEHYGQRLHAIADAIRREERRRVQPSGHWWTGRAGRVTIDGVSTPALCPSGHPLAGNVSERPDGHGCRCLSCHRRASREAMARHRARARLAAPTAACRNRRRGEYRPHQPPPVELRGGAAVVMCPRQSALASVFTTFESLAAAVAARCEAPGCIGHHIIVYVDDGRIHVWRPPRPPPPTLGAELRRCYPWRRPPPRRGRNDQPVFNPPPEWWPTPLELNPPLGPTGARGVQPRL